MAFTEAQIDKLKASFALAAKREDFTQSTLFYDNLFRRAPELRAMFRDDLMGQGMKFMRTLRIIIEGMGDASAFAEITGELGSGHRLLGVRKAHYEVMEEALIDTFREILGEDFDAETEAAWRAAYEEITRAMMAAR